MPRVTKRRRVEATADVSPQKPKYPIALDTINKVITGEIPQPPVVHDFAQVVPEAIDEKQDATLFEDLDDDAEAPIVGLQPYTRPDDGIVVDAGLTPSEKAQFAALLNQFLPLKERAIQLSKLAMYTDTKRAAVGLRAIQEINAITGISSASPVEITPMFALPADTKVNVTVTKVVK